MSVAPDLPTWDLSVYFPGLDSPEFAEAMKSAAKTVADLGDLYDKYHVQAQDEIAYTMSLAQQVEEVISATNAAGDFLRLIGCYVHGHLTTDSRNESAQARQSELLAVSAASGKLAARLKAWCGALPVADLVAHSELAKEHAFRLEKMKFESTRLMSPTEEALAADLTQTGGSAWSRLYGNYTSQLQVPVALAGETKNLPMSAVRNLAYEPDQSTRKTAYEAELAAWKGSEMVIASAFNAIKGESNLLAKLRGWNDLLEETLFRANIDEPTLDAMLAAATDAMPVFRRYMRAKAKLLGHKGGLPWYDLFAPVGEAKSWGYDQAMAFVVEKFGGYSSKLGGFAQRAFKENWVDVGPRLGKRDGAFCMGTRKDESRILMNFKPSFGSVSTLAHELGHGYHNVCLANRTSLQKQTPMTLAETASIFCETIAKRAALREVQDQEALNILEGSLQGACQVVVDIMSRFLFERDAVKWRLDRDVAPRELCEIMLRAQEETYGDGLDTDVLHPYMWAVKPHYYGMTFYNFPYMFGLLFGLGLYAVYDKEPKGFEARYDELLSSTGLADAATLAQGFGINIRDKHFWAQSLSVLEEDVKLFEKLVNGA